MLKTLFGSLRENKKGSIFTILLSIFEAAFEIFIPLCMAELIDKGIELGEMRAVVTRLTTDVTNIQNAYQMLIRMAVRAPIMLIFAMIASFRINTTVTFIFLAVIPIMTILLYLIIRKVDPIFKRVFHTYDDLNNIVQENVRGIRVVKSFHREDYEYEIGKFKGVSEIIYEDFAKGERLIAYNSPIMQFSSSL